MTPVPRKLCSTSTIRPMTPSSGEPETYSLKCGRAAETTPDAELTVVVMACSEPSVATYQIRES